MEAAKRLFSHQKTRRAQSDRLFPSGIRCIAAFVVVAQITGVPQTTRLRPLDGLHGQKLQAAQQRQQHPQPSKTAQLAAQPQSPIHAVHHDQPKALRQGFSSPTCAQKQAQVEGLKEPTRGLRCAARFDHLKVAFDIEPIARRYAVLGHDLFGNGGVVAIHLAV